MHKIIDKKSKMVNWDRFDYLMIRTLTTLSIVGAVCYAAKWAYIGLSWFMAL